MDYTYDAVVKTVHDGDTVTLDVDCGFNIWIHDMKIRLYGINAPELNTPEGKRSQAYLASRIPIGSKISVVTIKDKQEKYGRILGILESGSTGVGEFMNFNKEMVKNGYAKEYFGVGPKPV